MASYPTAQLFDYKLECIWTTATSLYILYVYIYKTAWPDQYKTILNCKTEATRITKFTDDKCCMASNNGTDAQLLGEHQ